MSVAGWETEWRATDFLQRLEWQLQRGPRKTRLLVIALYRELLSLLFDERSRQALDAAEQHADGLLTDAELQTARGIAEFAAWEAEQTLTFQMHPELRAAYGAALAATSNGELLGDRFADAMDVRGLITPEVEWKLWLEVYGPRGPTVFELAWRTSTVVSMARGMYESRDFGAMPILADALQDAGCDNSDILDHCRGPGPHVRGCWVVDLVLGKE